MGNDVCACMCVCVHASGLGKQSLEIVKTFLSTCQCNSLENEEDVSWLNVYV